MPSPLRACRPLSCVLLACLLVAGCGAEAPSGDETGSTADVDAAQDDRPEEAPSTPEEPGSGPDAEPDGAPEGLAERPAWLGTRVLPLRPDGLGEIQPTPPELDDRRLAPPDGLERPATEEFAATVGPVPDDVAARSTWSPHCPVGLDDLRYLTVTFWGFDDRPHTGELLVHSRVAGAVTDAFRAVYDARFPIEEMRVVAAEELDLPPTGDGNNTTAFVCRSTVTSSSWSQHAYGLAVDINPFHNPYARGDIVVPELASSYVDRARHRPGMIQPGDAVTGAFAAIGWGWGGAWGSAKDWMHFSSTGR